MKTYNFDSIDERVDYSVAVNSATNEEIIEKIKSMRSELLSQIPAYFRSHENDASTVTVYNGIGVMIDTHYPADKTTGLEHVKTHRQFVFAGFAERAMEQSLIRSLCGRLRLKTFKNGNLYAFSKREIEKILK